jgi:hypothetical protein
VQKQIPELQVSVNDIILVQVFDSMKNLQHEELDLWKGQSPASLHHFHQRLTDVCQRLHQSLGTEYNEPDVYTVQE